MPSTTELPVNHEQTVHQALGIWHADTASGSPLSGFLLVQQELAEGAASLRQATNKVLLVALTTLAASEGRSASLLHKRCRNEITSNAVDFFHAAS